MRENNAQRLGPALKAMLAHDAAALDRALEHDPELVHVRMCEDTLLEFATQPTAGDVPEEVIAVLIEGGAKLDRALNLAACWNRGALVAQLLRAGAYPAARADADITPLESAAMHGSTQAADVLVTHGLHRNTLWLAAASGQLELVQGWVNERGELLRPPGAYRPDFADVGRPQGAPHTDNPDEILGEALVFAAANARPCVVDYLLDAGVSIDARPYRNTTALHLAVQFLKVGMVQHLLKRGASTAIKDDTFHSDALGWAAACDKGDKNSSEIHSMIRDASEH